jgi:hypothetical protein
VQGVGGIDRLTGLAGLGSTMVAVSFGTILVSPDLGLTWSSQPSASDHSPLALSMPDQRTVVAGGAGVIVRGRR